MVLVLCPLPLEFRVVGKLLGQEKGVWVAQGDLGKVAYGVRATQWLIKKPEVHTLVCLGVGGALAPHVNIGDVVVGTESIEHDFYRGGHRAGLPLPEIKGHGEALNRFTNFHSSHFRLHLGGVASGDEDIVSSQRAGELFEKTKALAVAWEGMGGAKACRLLGRNFLEIRGITDPCQFEEKGSWKNNMEKSLLHAVEVFHFCFLRGDLVR